MVSVIFPAAGQGKRMGLGFNKIFTELSGKPILIQTLLTFSRCDCVDELIIAVDINEMEIIRKVLSKIPKLKPYKIVAGGSERQYSVYNGMGFIERVPDRNKLWAIQTPQGFKKEILIEAHKKAQEDNFLGTDEASLVRRTSHAVKLVMGDYNNIKVTTPTDLVIAEMLFGQKVKNHAKIKISSLFNEVFTKVSK